MITINIQTDNAAFEDGNYNNEVARILTVLAKSFEQGKLPERAMDINGNTVCYVAYED
jgi:hypothetical protein